MPPACAAHNIMNLYEEIAGECSKQNAERVATSIGADPRKFDELMQILFSEEKTAVKSAAWTMSHCADKYPHLIVPYIGDFVPMLKSHKLIAVRRNIARVLQFVDIPEAHQGELVNVCFDILLNPKDAVAVQAFSMAILYNITCEQPELKDELTTVIEDMLPHGTPGIKSRGKKIVKALRKL